MLLRRGDMRSVRVTWDCRSGSAPGFRPSWGLCGSSAVRAIVDQVAAAIEDKPRFYSRTAFGLVWSSCAEAKGLVMPESSSTRLIPEAQDFETQLQFAHSGGRCFCTACH
jgi:hypothetical protein